MPNSRWRAFLARTRFEARIWQAVRSGPPFRSRLDRIIIDLTHECDLACLDCNRSCGANQAPAAERIALEQVRRFVAESLEAGKRWRRIMLEGGEPTLHPQLEEIIDELLRYRRSAHAHCEIELCSNGHGPQAAKALRRLPRGVRVKNSAKSTGPAQGHFAFNVAPCDLAEFAGADYSQGCYIHRIFGLGLTRSGYYPHPVCAGIDRVFGFDIGMKRLPASAGEMAAQMRRLCPLCGHFREFRSAGDRWPRFEGRGGSGAFPPGSRSPSWKKAYRSFHEERPVLSLY
ncbi:MAG: radical SAM protein [Acidobacteria bacterium]|nr:radical SAM protein [Acidobacteriota bacterium]